VGEGGSFEGKGKRQREEEGKKTTTQNRAEEPFEPSMKK
jgi:hypothetical protein